MIHFKTWITNSCVLLFRFYYLYCGILQKFSNFWMLTPPALLLFLPPRTCVWCTHLLSKSFSNFLKFSILVRERGEWKISVEPACVSAASVLWGCKGSLICKTLLKCWLGEVLLPCISALWNRKVLCKLNEMHPSSRPPYASLREFYHGKKKQISVGRGGERTRWNVKTILSTSVNSFGVWAALCRVFLIL